MLYNNFSEREEAYYTHNTSLSNRGSSEKKHNGPVFSSKGSYNPTNLAVENSLRDIFDQFHNMVTSELKTSNWKEDD